MLDNASRLGPFEILAPIGAGGMGEVYRARDMRLDRQVAIKKVFLADRLKHGLTRSRATPDLRRYDLRVRPASRITAWFGVALTAVLAAACDGFVGEIALARVKPPRAESPSALVESFFRDYPHRLTGGLPAGEELRWIRPMLSDRLYAQFVSTLHYQREWIQRHPDQPSPDGGPPIILKPPFADGVHFDGSPDGHKSFKVVRTVPQSTDTWHVQIRFWWDPALAGWEHVVIVKSERGRYVIDDVLFAPDTPGERTSLLSEILASREPE